MKLAVRVVALAAFVAILVGSFQPFYLRMFTVNTEHMRAAFTELPWRQLPGFRRFLIDVDRTTPPHARIAICLPFRQWEAGYGYGFYRAGYLLPGKQATPLLADGADQFEPRNLANSEFLACWHATAQPAGFRLVWMSADGMLLRRIQ